MNEHKFLGIIGGLGPMSSAYFYELLISHTKVARDQDHIDLILSSRSSTPDRTAFIMGKSGDSPLPSMIRDAKMLEADGADAIVMICNTAHYFIDEIRRSISVPMPSIIEETASYIARSGKKKAAILATDGTLFSGAYQDKLTAAGVEYIVPTDDEQAKIMSVIYDYVKIGKIAPAAMLTEIRDALVARGCDCIIAGCTELPLAFRSAELGEMIVDPMEVLAYKVIKMFGKTPIGFADSFTVIE